MNRKQTWTPDRIRFLRGDLSRAEFAERLGVSALTVYRWELEDGAPEARRPRGKIAERLAAYAAEQAAATAAITAPAAPPPVHEPTPDELATILPLLEHLHDGAFSRAEAELLAILSSSGVRDGAIAALAAQALARLQLWARGDTIGAFATLLPLLHQAADGRLPPSVEAEVHVTAALLFSTFDGRVFDAGKTSAHVARAERLLPPHAHVQRFLLWMAQLLAANVLNDPALIEHVLARRDEVARDLPGRVVRCLAIEARLIQHYFSRRPASVAAEFRTLLDETGGGGLAYLHVRALAQAALARADDAAPPEEVLALVRRAEALCHEAGIAVGVHRLFTTYAEGEAQFRIGRVDDAERAWREGLRVAELLRYSTGTLPFFVARLLVLAGRPGEVRPLAEQVAAAQHTAYPGISRGLRDAILAVADVVDGDRSAAVDRLHDAVRSLDDHNVWTYLRRNMAVVDAAVATLVGTGRQATRALARADRVVDDAPVAWASACVRGLRGLLLLRAGRAADATSLLDDAHARLDAAGDRVSALALRALRARADHALGLAGAAEAIDAAGAEATALGLPGIAALASLAPAELDDPAPPAAAPGADRALPRLAAALAPLRAAATPDGVRRELIAALRAACPGAAIRVEQLDRRGAIEVIHDDGAIAAAPVEVSTPAGHQLRIQVAGADADPDRASAVEIVAGVAGLALDVAALRDVGARAAPAAAGDAADAPELPGFIAASPPMRRLRLDLARLARSRSTIIITGESGAGKEVVARALHDLSVRAGRPYVAFNCAAIPRELFEGQLFGYRKGSFTGAVADHPGVIRAAQGGTLFLDEIGELPLEVQPKLLRFLENGEISPLGEQRTVQVDVRVIAATLRDLEAQVRAGRFREDLFYRLQVVPIRVPPLRDRPEDVVALARHFVARLTPEGRDPPILAPDALVALTAHTWPGNVRELRNVIERSLAFEPWPSVLGAEHLRIT